SAGDLHTVAAALGLLRRECRGGGCRYSGGSTAYGTGAGTPRQQAGRRTFGNRGTQHHLGGFAQAARADRHRRPAAGADARAVPYLRRGRDPPPGPAGVCATPLWALIDPGSPPRSTAESSEGPP